VALKERYDRKIARMRAEDGDYQKAELMLAISQRMRQLMAESGKSRTDLANALGVSKAYVTKLLNDEDHNFGIWQLARFAAALDAKLEWDFRPLMAEEPPAPVPRWRSITDVCSRNYEAEEFGADAFSLAA